MPDVYFFDEEIKCDSFSNVQDYIWKGSSTETRCVFFKKKEDKISLALRYFIRTHFFCLVTEQYSWFVQTA
jgi:hypothetical protein